MHAWYLSYGGQQTGPLDHAAAAAQARQNPNGHCWRAGFAEWMPINACTELTGAAGGAMAGREIEKRARATPSYDITVSMETGGTRVVSVGDPAGLSVGSRVRVDGSNLIPR